jgi:hypothetical protein
VTGCRLHDMVLDLLRVSSQEENFITISSSNTSIVEGRSSSSNRVHRLVHQDKTKEQDSVLGMDLTHVRALIACRCDAIIIDKVQSFQLLRILALEACPVVNLEHVEKLLHLRYLGVIETSIIGELPKGIGALKLLQTLDIGWNAGQELSSSLGMLTQLTCLRTGYSLLPNGVIEKLTSLEELQIYCHEHMVGPFVKELGKLRELRVLYCKFTKMLDKSKQSDLVASLGNLHKIRHLVLHMPIGMGLLEKGIWDEVVLPRRLRRLDIIGRRFSALPSCINPSDLPNLTHLKLEVRDLDEQGLKSLGALPELCHLSLETSSTVTITVSDGFFFARLRCLVLHESMVLFVLSEDSSISFTIWCYEDDVAAFGSPKGIVKAPAVMPNLQVLHFEVVVGALVGKNGSCDKLGLEYLPSLQKVRVELYRFHASADDVKRQKAALRHAIEAHPNRPTLLNDIDS